MGERAWPLPNGPAGFCASPWASSKPLQLSGGFPLRLPAPMALVGIFTDNHWVRLIVALVVAVGLPLFVVDRLLPDDNVKSARGMPTDTLALTCAGFVLVLFFWRGPGGDRQDRRPGGRPPRRQ